MAYSSAVNRDWKYAYLSSAVQATSHALMRSQNYLILPVLFLGGHLFLCADSRPAAGTFRRPGGSTAADTASRRTGLGLSVHPFPSPRGYARNEGS